MSRRRSPSCSRGVIARRAHGVPIRLSAIVVRKRLDPSVLFAITREHRSSESKNRESSVNHAKGVRRPIRIQGGPKAAAGWTVVSLNLQTSDNTIEIPEAKPLEPRELVDKGLYQ